MFFEIEKVQAVWHQLAGVPDESIIFFPHAEQESHFLRAFFDSEEFDKLQANTSKILTRFVIEQNVSVGAKAMRTRKFMYITWMHLDCLAWVPAKRLSPGSADFIKF